MDYISDKFKPESIMIPSIFSKHHLSCETKDDILHFCILCSFFYCDKCSDKSSTECPDCSETKKTL